MDIANTKLGKLFGMRAEVEKVRRAVPLHLRPETDLISRGLPQSSEHLLNKKGSGLQYFDQTKFIDGQHDPKGVHAGYSRRRGHKVYVEKEAEVRHHYYFFADNTPSMNVKSDKAPYTPGEAGDLVMMAIAKHVARNGERVGMLQTGLTTHGSSAPEWLAAQLVRNHQSQEIPRLGGRLAPQSSAVIISDFMPSISDIDEPTPENVEARFAAYLKSWGNCLNQLRGKGIGTSWVIMMIDPEIIDIDFKKTDVFEDSETPGLEYQGGKGQHDAQRKEFEPILREHLRQIRDMARAYQFKFIMQRTDEPLENTMRGIFFKRPAHIPASIVKLGLDS